MALNLNQTRFLQPLRSNTVHSTIQAAIEDIKAIESELSLSNHSDGISVVARYKDGNKIKSVLGIFANTNDGYGFTYFVLDSDKMDALLERVTTLETKVGKNSVIDTITTEIQKLDSTATSTNGEFVNITVVEEDGKLISASVNESGLNIKIQAIEKSVTDEKARAEAAEGALDGRLDVIEGEGEGSIKKAVADAKSELMGDAAEEYNTLGKLEDKIQALDAAIGEGGSVTTQIEKAIQALDSEKTGDGTYVDVSIKQVDGVITEVAVDETGLNTKIGAIEKSVTDEASARAAADDKIEASIGLAADGSHIATEGNYTKEATTIAGEIAALDAQVKLNADAIAAAVNDAKSYSIVSISGNDLTALGENVKEAWKLVDEENIQAGDVIKVYKDSSLKSVSLEDVIVDGGDDTQNLVFTYILANGEEEVVRVDISSFVSEAEFKDGLQVVNGEVSIKLAEGSESFLSVSENGVKLSGVQDAIDAAVKTEKDRAELAEKGLSDRLSALETGDNSVAKQIENAINELDATVSTVREGETHFIDVEVVEEDGKLISATLDESALNTKIQAIEKSVTDEKARAEAAEGALDGRLDAIEGDKTFVKAVNVNNVEATIADNKAIVTIDGSDIKLSTDYIPVEYPSQVQDKFIPVATESTLDIAVTQIEFNLSRLVQEVLDNEMVTAAAITEIKESVGLDENLKYVPNTLSTYISSASSFAEADSLLDSAISSEVSALNERIDNVSDAAISIKKGNGISISENGTEKTISAVAKANDSLIEVNENGIGLKDAGYIDCGKF